MEVKFREAIMKIANNPANQMRLTSRHKTLIEKTISNFLADYHTPDHPPYAAMIMRAIEELKEKRGSSEESISMYIKNEYKDLPWAHCTLLKHHLAKLCDDGEVIITKKRFYLLAGANFSLKNSSGPKEKLKRKRGSASGRRKSKRFRKTETRDDNRETEVMEGKLPLSEENERLNAIVESKADVIEEDRQLLEVPIEMIKEHGEDDQEHRELPDYLVNNPQGEMVEGQSLKSTNVDGFVEEHISDSNRISLDQDIHPLALAIEHSQTGSHDEKSDEAKHIEPLSNVIMDSDLPLNSEETDKQNLSALSISQEQEQHYHNDQESNLERQLIESEQVVAMEESPESERMRRQLKRWDHQQDSSKKHCDQRKKRVENTENHQVPNHSDKIGEAKKQLEFLELVSMEQDELLSQLEFLTPEESQQAPPQGSNGKIGSEQRSKLRSSNRHGSLDQNALTSPQCPPQSKDRRNIKSSNTLVQRAKLRSWKKCRRTNLSTKKPARGRRGKV